MRLKRTSEVIFYCETCEERIPMWDLEIHVHEGHVVKKITTTVIQRDD